MRGKISRCERGKPGIKQPTKSQQCRQMRWTFSVFKEKVVQKKTFTIFKVGQKQDNAKNA
jgi:hypothetical protein